MKFRRRYDFGKLFHISRFDIDDIEALVLDVKIPEVDSEIVATDECLSIAID